MTPFAGMAALMIALAWVEASLVGIAVLHFHDHHRTKPAVAAYVSLGVSLVVFWTLVVMGYETTSPPRP